MGKTAAQQIPVLVLGVALLAAGAAIAEENAAPETVASEPARQEWKSRIDDARRRVDQMRRERRLAPIVEPSPRQLEEERSRRALEDSSLQIGDIVATDRGLFRFNGRSTDDPNTSYFSPLGKALPSRDGAR